LGEYNLCAKEQNYENISAEVLHIRNHLAA
jgi:hypothetical protein